MFHVDVLSGSKESNLPCFSVAQVVDVGRHWRLAFEDGQRGVYQLSSKTSTGVKRSHVVMDTDRDTPALVDGLAEKTEKYTLGLMIDTKSKAGFNDPDMSRVQSFLGICSSLDSILGHSPEDQDSAATTTSAIQVRGKQLPPVPHFSTSTGAAASSSAVMAPTVASHNAQDDEEPSSRFTSLAAKATTNSTGPSPRVKPKAAPKTKKGKGVEQDATKIQEKENQNQNQKRENHTVPKAKAQQKGRNVESLDPALTVNRTKASSSSAMMDQDTKWNEDTTAEIKDLMNMEGIRSGETEFKADMSEKVKAANTILGAVRARKRLYRRRSAENQEGPMAIADEMEDQLCAFLQLTKNLTKSSPSPADEWIAKAETLESSGAVLGNEVVTRISKAMWADNLRYKRWDSMLGETFEFVKSHISEVDKSSKFLLQQMTVVLQKLLKGISADAAP